MLPLKLSFFAWRLLFNYLPIDTILQSRGFSLVSKCECCGDVESAMHLFVEGDMAREVWDHFFPSLWFAWTPFFLLVNSHYVLVDVGELLNSYSMCYPYCCFMVSLVW